MAAKLIANFNSFFIIDYHLKQTLLPKSIALQTNGVMNFVDHHIVRCGLVSVHTWEMPGWIEFAIQIGLPRGGYYPIFKMGQL